MVNVTEPEPPPLIVPLSKARPVARSVSVCGALSALDTAIFAPAFTVAGLGEYLKSLIAIDVVAWAAVAAAAAGVDEGEPLSVLPQPVSRAAPASAAMSACRMRA
ncbi:MAG: hypothetical protein QOE11_3057 [Solirubrobacteraceae bacterium]|nr:hypothetical protein [Solirubrobacteraceae bacterium]